MLVPALSVMSMLVAPAVTSVSAEEFADAGPHCPPQVDHCFGIELFIVRDGQGWPRPPTWWRGQIERANVLFAEAGIGLETAAVREIESRWSHVITREDRDRLGRRRRTRGWIPVFVVRQLDDVDVPGEKRYGVHWRDRSNVKRRWVILSAKDRSSTVLVHELGHFFGLRHSKYEVSVMNKRPRKRPWSQREFAPPELARIVKRRNAMLSSGFLQPRPRARHDSPARLPVSSPVAKADPN